MAIQFAKDEKIIKSFNYAAAGYNKKKGTHEAFKNLIVTNKRVIHEAVRETRGFSDGNLLLLFCLFLETRKTRRARKT